MMALISAVIGFAAPFLPEVLKLFGRYMDNKQEIALFKLRMEMASQEHLYKMEEINARADIEEMKTLRMPQASFGVQVIDAAAKLQWNGWERFLVAPVFYLFAFLDFMTGIVRPGVTVTAFVFYGMVKYAMYEVAWLTSGDKLQAMLSIWGEQDWSVLLLVLSYWFGARTAKQAFGGSTNTAYRNG